MSTKDIPNEHHFVRHVEGIRVQRDDEGKIISVFPAAMALRPLKSGAEQELSGCYLEFFTGERHEQLAAICTILRRRIKTRVGALDAVAVLNASAIRAAGSLRDMNLRVLHEPKPKALDKAAIRGLPIPPATDDELNSALAALALLELLDMADFPVEPVANEGPPIIN